MKHHAIILLLILAGLVPTPAQTRDEKRSKMSAAEEAVRMAQVRRFEAMMRGQVRLLDRLLDDDITYTHSNGTVDTKADLLQSLKTGAIRYDLIEPDDVQVRLYGQAAVVTGQARMKVRRQGQPFDFRVRFTEVYARRNNQWLLVAWQSTQIEEH